MSQPLTRAGIAACAICRKQLKRGSKTVRNKAGSLCHAHCFHKQRASKPATAKKAAPKPPEVISSDGVRTQLAPDPRTAQKMSQRSKRHLPDELAVVKFEQPPAPRRSREIQSPFRQLASPATTGSPREPAPAGKPEPTQAACGPVPWHHEHVARRCEACGRQGGSLTDGYCAACSAPSPRAVEDEAPTVQRPVQETARLPRRAIPAAEATQRGFGGTRTLRVDNGGASMERMAAGYAMRHIGKVGKKPKGGG